MPELQGVNLEQYRGKMREEVRVTVERYRNESICQSSNEVLFGCIVLVNQGVFFTTYLQGIGWGEMRGRESRE